MRVRVRFRVRADTGEVETFVVEDTHEGAPLADHDARHDATTLAVARIIDANPSMSEVVGEPDRAAVEAPVTVNEQEDRPRVDRQLRD